MATKQLPDPSILRKFLRYDEATGKLFWRRRGPELSGGYVTRHLARWNTSFAGKAAGSVSRGYVSLRILGSSYKAHRIILAMHLGRDPGEVDHLNGNRADNRLTNLREVTGSENNQNRCRPSTNSSGAMGVFFAKKSGRWGAQIGLGGRTLNLGRFDTFAEAVAARKAAERRIGYHPNHGH